MSRLVLTNRRPQRCAVCHDTLGDEALLICPACGSVVHGECRGRGTRCPTFGCRGALGAPVGRVPTELPPTPRRVRATRRFQLRCLVPLLIPHFWIGLGLLAYGLFSLLIVTLGSDYTAHVSRTEVHHSTKGGASYSLRLAYAIPGGPVEEWATVDEELYEQMSAPGAIPSGKAIVTVRRLSFGPLHGSAVVESLWTSSGLPMLPFALFWCGMMSIFAYMLMILPIRRWLLVKHGVATPGTIVERRVGAKGAKSVKFRFAAPDTRVPITAQMPVSNEQYERAREGQVVTVLHHPLRPSFAIVYELCGHVVEE